MTLTTLTSYFLLISLIVGSLIGLGKIARWLYQRVKTLDVTQDFVAAVATNHLPHIYHAQIQQGRALVKIAERLDVQVAIDETEPPPITFISKSTSEGK